MQLCDPRRHRSLVARNLALAGEQNALEAQLNFLMRLVDGSADLEEAIRWAQGLVAR